MTGRGQKKTGPTGREEGPEKKKRMGETTCSSRERGEREKSMKHNAPPTSRVSHAGDAKIIRMRGGKQRKLGRTEKKKIHQQRS